MNKRGLSRVITVILLIFLAVAATIIIWNVARIFIEREAELSKLKTQLLLERMEIVKVDINPPSEMTLSIRKNNEKVRYISTETLPGTPAAIDIISVADISDSMGSAANPNSQLSAAKNANKGLIANIIGSNPDNRVGLAPYYEFANNTYGLDLTNDVAQLNAKIDAWKSKHGTCICCGILNATYRFLATSPPGKPKAMIVMSDGLASYNCSELGNVGDMNKDGHIKSKTDSAKDHAINASWYAMQKVPNLIIYTIGFGNPLNPSDLDQDTLRNISAFGNGEYYYAEVNTISEIYKTIGEQIVKKYQTIKVMDYLRVVFYSDTLSYQQIIPNPPEKMYELKKYKFNIPPEMTNIKRIEIYPIILTASGEEVIGPLLDVQKFP